MLKSFFILIILAAAAAAQTEVLTNETVIEMTQAGLGKQIILTKIRTTEGDYDVSAGGLIALKKAGVEDEVIELIFERSRAAPPAPVSGPGPEPSAVPVRAVRLPDVMPVGSPREALASAKTIALEKSSLHPSRQALEKELLKRAEFRKHNLTITRYKEEADLYVEMGYVSGSLVTHRYAYRIYDRRSGAVLAAGETTSWGSLASNLAKHITRSLNEIAGARSNNDRALILQ